MCFRAALKGHSQAQLRLPVPCSLFVVVNHPVLRNKSGATVQFGSDLTPAPKNASSAKNDPLPRMAI